MARIVVTRPIPRAALDRLRGAHDVEVLDDIVPLETSELRSRCAGADAILALVTDPIDADLMAGAKRLRAIANMAVGFDNIDVAAATARGIPVTNTPDVLTETSADLAFALLLAAARRVIEGDRRIRDGSTWRWGPLALLGVDVHGKTLGILGPGRIGTAVARRGALGFGMKILYHARGPHPQLERDLAAELRPPLDLAAESDFVSVHLPLDETTHHLVDGAFLAAMRPHAVLVNTARGPIVDEAALVRTLGAGEIAAAGLDVYEHEPRLEPGLIELDNVVLLPHIGSASEETRAAMAHRAVDNLLAAIAGDRPTDLVNPDALDVRRRANRPGRRRGTT